MANDVQQQQVRRFTWVTPSAQQGVIPTGLSADEVKIHQAQKVARPEIMPIAQRGPVEFISPTTSMNSMKPPSRPCSTCTTRYSQRPRWLSCAPVDSHRDR